MKQRHSLLFRLLPIAFIAGLMVMQADAQTVNVKMRINTSTCLDTLGPSGLVLVCGESVSGTTPSITWDNATGIIAVNKGGDYWEATFQATPGDVIKYKFVTYFSADNPTFHWTGWEGPINAGVPSGNNRLITVGSSDTTLDLQYYNGWENTVDQFWRPFEVKPDTVAIYFRVNMGGADFNPASNVVDVRGGLPLGNDNPWSVIKVLSREANSVNGGSFWSGVAYLPKSSITPGSTQQAYKFVIQPDTWESSANRTIVFSGKNDTTILWKYFNNFPPSGPKVTADVLFTVRTDALEKSNLFNRALGDKIAVTGAKGWPPNNFNPLTDFDTTASMLKMTYDPDVKEWSKVESFTKFPNEVITYKYYIAWDGSRVDSTSPNFIKGLALSDGWEEPGVTGGADRKYTYTDQLQQSIPGDFGSPAQFFNSLHWKGAITSPIKVTFNINMGPAADVTQNPGTLFKPGIDTAYIQFDGSLAVITQGKTMWGTDNRLMLTDIDGDGIYSATWEMNAPTLYQFCYRVVYTSTSGEIWNGSGSAILGRRYYQYVHPVKVTADSAVWPSTYSLAEMPWMLDSLTIEDPPNLDQVSAVGGDGSAIPEAYGLQQNYPNPFNPSTVITYTVPHNVHVTLAVYNVLGQKVATLADLQQIPGTHSVVWNAAASYLSSGMYVVQMRAGSFTQVRKMLLTK
ncbi:MAG: T9SS type A sorting domain-containing protein [Bacteroidota bacterium]